MDKRGSLVTGFLDECSFLGPLESFDPAAFDGDGEVSQDLCDFVLSLALMYNDLKDEIYAHEAVFALMPAGQPTPTRLRGAISGVQLHAFRATCALLFELFTVINEKRELLCEDFFRRVVKQLPKAEREAWGAVVNVARGTSKPKTELGKKLLLFRNKVGSHYDTEEIARGFKHFFEVVRRLSRAYVSRGQSMRETRFYFADAAMQGYLIVRHGSPELQELKGQIAGVVEIVNFSLKAIVQTFIQSRGSAFRGEAEAES